MSDRTPRTREELDRDILKRLVALERRSSPAPPAAGAGYRYLSTLRFTASGTFVKADHPGLRAIRVRLVGGGGSGGGAAATSAGNNSYGSGGGAGGYAESFITDLATVPASVAVTVGAGGAAAATAGTGGAASSFGSLVAAEGGAGGEHKLNSALGNHLRGGTGGTGTAGDFFITGNPGDGGGGANQFASGGNGGSSPLGSGGRGFASSSSGSLVARMRWRSSRPGAPRASVAASS